MTSEHDDAIREFWTWWATARHRVLAVIGVDRHFSDELVDDISRHVDAIGDLDCAGQSDCKTKLESLAIAEHRRG